MVGPFPLLPNLTQQFLQCPDVIRDPRFHCGSDADRAVDSHEIVVGKIQGERSVVILPLLTEGVRQPSESANLHSHGQVLALDM